MDPPSVGRSVSVLAPILLYPAMGDGSPYGAGTVWYQRSLRYTREEWDSAGRMGVQSCQGFAAIAQGMSLEAEVCSPLLLGSPVCLLH